MVPRYRAPRPRTYSRRSRAARERENRVALKIRDAHAKSGSSRDRSAARPAPCPLSMASPRSLRALHRALGNFNFGWRGPARQILDRMPVGVARGEIHSPKLLPSRRTWSTRLTLSKNTCQSNAEVRRMLVMMLRTVTLIAACSWCSARTISSAVVPCAARRSSSQSRIGPTLGSRSRRRWIKLHREGAVQRLLFKLTQHRRRARRLPALPCPAGCRPEHRPHRARARLQHNALRQSRRFSTSTMRSVIATAQSSPM